MDYLNFGLRDYANVDRLPGARSSPTAGRVEPLMARWRHFLASPAGKTGSEPSGSRAG